VQPPIVHRISSLIKFKYDLVGDGSEINQSSHLCNGNLEFRNYHNCMGLDSFSF